MSSELHKIFPLGIREKLQGLDLLQEGFTELRFRCGNPVMLLRGREEWFLHKGGGLCQSAGDAYLVSVNELREMMEYISNYSVYAYEEELRQGFLTIQGGHRVGVCGKVVLTDGKVKTIRNISFLNIRLAREKKGCADGLLPYLFEKDRLCHTLLIAAPGCGKTTILRDLIRQLSNGSSLFRGRKIGVVDERSELGACYHGIPQNDLGLRTDVLDSCPKSIGMELLLRSMSPEVIAVDELGQNDSSAVERLMTCGCIVFAAAHGERRDFRFFEKTCEGKSSGKESGEKESIGKKSIELENTRVRGNTMGKKEEWQNMFERFVFLKPGAVPGIVECICDRQGNEVTPAW